MAVLFQATARSSPHPSPTSTSKGSKRVSFSCLVRSSLVFSVLFSAGCIITTVVRYDDLLADPFFFRGGDWAMKSPLILPAYTKHYWAASSSCHSAKNSSGGVANPAGSSFVCMGPSRHVGCRDRPDQLNTTASHPRIAVAVIAAHRPAYLKSMLQALAQQETNVPFDVHLFIDFCETDEDNGNAAVKQLASEFQAARQSTAHNATYIHSNFVTNQGIARLTWAAMETAFSNSSSSDNTYTYYDQLVLLEEDHVVASNYVATLSELLLISDSMDSIGVVAGTILDAAQMSQTTNLLRIMTNTSACSYQIAPLDGFTSLSSHNIWAWGMSRHKYSRIRDLYYDGLHRTGLLSTTRSYAQRDTRRIARWMRSTCGSNYHHWQGQDWLRACSLAAAGMPYKLLTVDRTLQYIGKYGLHTNAQAFASKQYAVEEPVPTQRLERIREDMCSEALCYSDLVTVG